MDADTRAQVDSELEAPLPGRRFLGTPEDELSQFMEATRGL